MSYMILTEFTTKELILQNIIPAIIALIGVIFSVVATCICSFIVNKKNLKANLVISARIEWIQEVRKNTSNLINLYNNLILNSNKKNNLLKYDGILLSKDLFILYFGNDAKKLEENKLNILEINKVLNSNENNNSKNDYIVYFINTLNKKILTLINLDFQFNNTENKVLNIFDDYDFNEYKFNISYKTNENDNYVKENLYTDIVFDILYFRDVMRNYFKLEWKKVKSLK